MNCGKLRWVCAVVCVLPGTSHRHELAIGAGGNSLCSRSLGTSHRFGDGYGISYSYMMMIWWWDDLRGYHGWILSDSSWPLRSGGRLTYRWVIVCLDNLRKLFVYFLTVYFFYVSHRYICAGCLCNMILGGETQIRTSRQSLDRILMIVVALLRKDW